MQDDNLGRVKPGERDYLEDFQVGSLELDCADCGQPFKGASYRLRCKLCEYKPQIVQPRTAYSPYA